MMCQVALLAQSPPFQNQDIGSVGVAGSNSFSNGVWTVKGSGSDIWNTADAFQFAYLSQGGDFQIVAQVTSVQLTDPWAKAGVMIRETLSSTSRHVFFGVTPSNGLIFEQRISGGGISYATVVPGIAAPRWVKLVRQGSYFRAYYSSDGIQWQFVGEQMVVMSAQVSVGLAVTAHNNSVLCTATFANVQILGAQTGDGLTGQYYNGTNFTGLVLTRTDATVNFSWGIGSPGPGVNSDNFSVRWSGQIQPQFSETYTFYTTADDGVRLWVDGRLLINNWIDQGTTEKSGTIILVAGRRYNIVLEYYDHCCDAVAQLQWSSPSTSKQIVPTSVLYRDGTFAVAPGLRGSVACRDFPTVVYDVYVPTNYSAGGVSVPILYTFNPGGGGMVDTFQNVASQLQLIVVGVTASHNGIGWPDYSDYEHAVIYDIRTRMNFDATSDFSGGLSGGGWASFDDSKVRRAHVTGVLSMSGWLGRQYFSTDRYLPGLLAACSAGNNGSDGALGELVTDANYLLPFGCVVRDWVFSGGHQTPPDSVLAEMLTWMISARIQPASTDKINADIQASLWRANIQAGQKEQAFRQCLTVVLNQPRTWLAHQADIIIDELMSNYAAFRLMNLNNLAAGDYALDYFYYRAYGAGKLGDSNQYFSAVLALNGVRGTSGDRTNDVAVYGTATNDLAVMQSQFGTPDLAPIGVADGYSLLSGTVLNIAAPGLLANDFDPNGNTGLTASLAMPAGNGIVQLNPNGAIQYSPSSGFMGIDNFTYVVNDGVGPSTPASVTLTVLPNPLPSLRIAGTNVLLIFSTTTNLTYNVQSATNLQSGLWSTIASNLAGTGASWTNIDIGAATVPKRFYRIGVAP